MPLRSVSLTSRIRAQVTESLDLLTRDGLIKERGKAVLSVKPSFRMGIQLVPEKKFHTLEFGAPEGIRVFVKVQNNVVAAVDYLFEGKDLKLLHIYGGKALDELVGILHRFKKELQKEKAIFHLQFISIIPSPGYYFMVSSVDEKRFYKAWPGLDQLPLYEWQEEIREYLLEKQRTSKKFNA